MKTRLLKITLSFAMLFIAAGAFSQQLQDNGTNLPILAEDTASNATDSVTVGYTVPYYVTPDPVLNSFSEPYDINGTNDGLNSTWDWTFTDGSHFTDTTQGGSLDPYIEVTWADIDGTVSGESTTITVNEVGPSGTCAGADSILSVNVFDPPQFDFTNAGSGNNNDTLVEVCATAGAQNVTVNNITDNNVSGGNFKFRLDIEVDSVAAENASSTGASLGNIRGGTGSAQEDTIVAISETYGSNVTLLPNYYMTAVDGKITRYRFDFGNTLYGASSSNGITDHIQRKSQYLTNSAKDDQAWDYIADLDNNGNTADDNDGSSMVTFIVYPAPNTGNIHYVPNNFDQ